MKDEPEIRVICDVKSSLAPEGDAIAFRLDKEKGFHWIGKYDISAEGFIVGDGRGRKDPKCERIFKRDLNKWINGTGKNSGRSKRTERKNKKKTLWNAKKELQIDSVKIGNKWFWMLQEE